MKPVKKISKIVKTRKKVVKPKKTREDTTTYHEHPALAIFKQSIMKSGLYYLESGYREKLVEEIEKMAFEQPKVWSTDPERLKVYLASEEKVNKEMYRLLHLTKFGAFIEKLKRAPEWFKVKWLRAKMWAWRLRRKPKWSYMSLKRRRN